MTGTGFNPNLTLNQSPVEQSSAAVFQVGLGIVLPVSRAPLICLEPGIAGRYIVNSGRVNQVYFRTRTLRALVPLTLAIYHHNWKFAGGISVQNNRDFDEMIWQQAYNLRLNGLIRVNYHLTDRLLASLEYSHSLSSLGDSFFMVDPRFSILAGFSFLLRNNEP